MDINKKINTQIICCEEHKNKYHSDKGLESIKHICNSLNNPRHSLQDTMKVFFQADDFVQCVFFDYSLKILENRANIQDVKHYLMANKIISIYLDLVVNDIVKDYQAFQSYDWNNVISIYNKSINNLDEIMKTSKPMTVPRPIITESKTSSKTRTSTTKPKTTQATKKTVTKKTSGKNKYENEFQKYEKPSNLDPLYIFYSSLYDENPESQMAIKWLIEHGIILNDEMVESYKNL